MVIHALILPFVALRIRKSSFFFFPLPTTSSHLTFPDLSFSSLLLQILACFFYTRIAVAWQLPTHPACAMFVSNHETRHRGIPPSSPPSSLTSTSSTSTSLSSTPSTTSSSPPPACQPSTSVYLGQWYDVATVCANYHVEHHDFPEVGH